jgi:CMP/dCMP kinase
MPEEWSTEGAFQDTGTYPAQASPIPSGDWNRPPRPDPIDLITISREFGAGGSDLARELGIRLQWPVLDRDLVHEVARRLRLDPRHVEPVDERTSTWVARLVASALLMTPPELHVDVDSRTVVHPDAVAEAARTAILAKAQTRPLIVVGHGAQCLFRGRPGTLHVRLVAPLERRVDRICRRDTCDRVAAAQVARRMDEMRRAYVRRHYHADVRDPLLYDLQINTDTIPIEMCVDVVAAAIGGDHVVPSRVMAEAMRSQPG